MKEWSDIHIFRYASLGGLESQKAVSDSFGTGTRPKTLLIVNRAVDCVSVMGNVESRFYSLLLSGESQEALQMWLSNPEDLQELFHPNVPIKSSPYRDNPLHCAARHGMKVMMHEFLEKGADPYARNDNGETAMHIVCRTARGSSRTSKRQKELLSLLLDKISEMPLEDSYDIAADTGLQNDKAESNRLIETWPAMRSNALHQEDSKQEDKLHLGIQDKVSML